jgi:hypothetical protein
VSAVCAVCDIWDDGAIPIEPVCAVGAVWPVGAVGAVDDGFVVVVAGAVGGDVDCG